jgi:protein TonB
MTAMRKIMLAAVTAAIAALASPAIAQNTYYFTGQGHIAASATATSQSSYVARIAAAIRSQLFYPRKAHARGARGVVGVAFTIGASGRLSSFAITRSSGDEDLDKAARTLVEATRFPPPPGGPVYVAMSVNYAPR